MSGRGSGCGGGRGKPLCKFATDGKPLKLNEHGLYVLDHAKWQKQQKAQTIDVGGCFMTVQFNIGQALSARVKDN